MAINVQVVSSLSDLTLFKSPGIHQTSNSIEQCVGSKEPTPRPMSAPKSIKESLLCHAELVKHLNFQND